MSYNFSLPNSEELIFLHAIDGHFEKEDGEVEFNNMKTSFVNLKLGLCELEDHAFVDHFDVNVKFILSLDEEENFDDLSTEGCSDAEDTIRDSIDSLKSSEEAKALDIQKCKVSDFLNQNTIKSEIDKIRNETIQNLRTYQIQMQNNYMMMRQYYENVYKTKYMETVQKASNKAG